MYKRVWEVWGIVGYRYFVTEVLVGLWGVYRPGSSGFSVLHG